MQNLSNFQISGPRIAFSQLISDILHLKIIGSFCLSYQPQLIL